MSAPTLAALAGLATIAAGCGDNLRPVTDGVRSGDRLAATFWVGDGARLFAGFLDRELGLRCRFEMLPDEEHAVCLPTASAIATEFLDERCTLPVVPATGSPTGERPRVALVESSACEPPAIWTLGEPIALTQRYARTPAGGCAWRAGEPGARWHPAIRALGLDELVPGRAQVEDRGDTLRVRYVDGDDGSRQPIGMYDARMRAPCGFVDRVTFGVPVARACYPELCVVGNVQWRDEHCRPILPSFVDPSSGLSPRCACHAPRFALLLPSEPLQDPRAPQIRPVAGALSSPVELWSGTAEVCELVDYAAFDAWSTGDPIEPVAGRRTVLEGSGRLRPVATVAEDGATMLEPWLRDREVGTECEPRVARDGVRRCLPTGLTQLLDSFFADPDCTRPVRVAYAGDFDGSTRWAIDDDDGGGGGRTVLLVSSEALPGNLFHGGFDVPCVPFSWQHPIERYYLLGPEAAPERFAAMSVHVE